MNGWLIAVLAFLVLDTLAVVILHRAANAARRRDLAAAEQGWHAENVRKLARDDWGFGDWQ